MRKGGINNRVGEQQEFLCIILCVKTGFKYIAVGKNAEQTLGQRGRKQREARPASKSCSLPRKHTTTAQHSSDASRAVCLAVMRTTDGTYFHFAFRVTVVRRIESASSSSVLQHTRYPNIGKRSFHFIQIIWIEQSNRNRRELHRATGLIWFKATYRKLGCTLILRETKIMEIEREYFPRSRVR